MTKTSKKTDSNPTEEVKKEARGSTCGICGKYFRYEHKMRVHLRIHTGELPFSCSYCEKSFAQKAALTVHERTHTGEKPFVCELCNKAFARADHLNQHNRTHTGEKPYACSECGKSFATWSAISRHKMEHSSRESFRCTQCIKTFSRTDNLRAHILKMHAADKTDSAKQSDAAAIPTARKKKAQTKAKKVPKELDIVSSSNQEDIDAIAKILQEEENRESDTLQGARDTNVPSSRLNIKDKPLEKGENRENSETSNAAISHINNDRNIHQEEVNVKAEPLLEDEEEENASSVNDMLGSHFLYG